MTKLGFIAAAGLIAGSAAHMCTFQPLQRGGAAGAGSPHANICAQTTGPCPTSTAGAPVAVYVPGQKIQIVMQKNLDHFAASTPGNFSAFLWNSTGSIFWGSVPDSPAPTLSLYTLNVQVPTNIPSGNYVVQTIYGTNNAGAPADFFQCSDVQIVTSPEEQKEAIASADAEFQAKGHQQHHA